MSRWQPDAQGRLAEAALELYREHGYDQTTVAEIAARAGLTERTFFRYFADKREVLFYGSERFRAVIVDALHAVPKSVAPFAAVIAALEAASTFIEEHAGHAGARKRSAVIASHAELLERELIKLASVAAAMSEKLRARGVKEPAASLAAEAGIAVFKIAFERWLEDKKPRPLAQQLRASVAALQQVTASEAVP